jgi:hypothetical protein
MALPPRGNEISGFNTESGETQRPCACRPRYPPPLGGRSPPSSGIDEQWYRASAGPFTRNMRNDIYDRPDHFRESLGICQLPTPIAERQAYGACPPGNGGCSGTGRRPLSSVPSHSRGAREAKNGYAAYPARRVHGALFSCGDIRMRAAHGSCRDVCSVNLSYPGSDIDLAADNRTLTPHNAARAEGH